jgi:hypothetical protein
MPNIFLCYAKEDQLAVSGVYLALKDGGLSPWMDSPPEPFENQGILAGQMWDLVIREKIQEADIVLAFFSHASIRKEGHVQREYRLALDCSLERPIDVPFLVPVLLERCEPPPLRIGTAGFHELHWFRLYKKEVDDLVSQNLFFNWIYTDREQPGACG